MPNPFFTIGHSTRAIDEFIALLHAGNVTLLADVRTVPRSRHNPQFNEGTLQASLAEHGIGYQYFKALGGLRPRSKDVTPQVNGYWENDSFHNYADYALTPEFRDGLNRLIALGKNQRCAIMCAESLWWRCHRRIIADYLLAGGHEVCHLMDGGKIEPAHMTESAQVQKDGTITYPAAQGTLL